MTAETTPRRVVRSFVRREGRMTEAQRRALEQHRDEYELAPSAQPCNQPWDLDTVFGRAAPRRLEIGFGMGESLFAMATAQPEIDFLGVEVYRPGVGHLMRRLNEHGLRNVRIVCDDAVEVLGRMIVPASLDAIFLFFPDPWPKKRHHKRRLLNAGFAALAASCLRPGGVLHMATDWEDYAHQALAVLEATPALANTADRAADNAGGFAPRPQWREVTRFERRGERLGHGVWDLIFRRDA